MNFRMQQARTLAAVALVLIGAWALVTRLIEIGPPWVVTVLVGLAAIWMAFLALASLWFALRMRARSDDAHE